MRTLKASATPIHAPLNISASLNAIVRVLRWNIPRSNATRRNTKTMNAAHSHIRNPSGPNILGAALLLRARPATLAGSAAPRIDGGQIGKEIPWHFEDRPADTLQAMLSNGRTGRWCSTDRHERLPFRHGAGPVAALLVFRP